MAILELSGEESPLTAADVASRMYDGVKVPLVEACLLWLRLHGQAWYVDGRWIPAPARSRRPLRQPENRRQAPRVENRPPANRQIAGGTQRALDVDPEKHDDLRAAFDRGALSARRLMAPSTNSQLRALSRAAAGVESSSILEDLKRRFGG